MFTNHCIKAGRSATLACMLLIIMLLLFVAACTNQLSRTTAGTESNTAELIVNRKPSADTGRQQSIPPTTSQQWVYAEWSLDVDSYPGNPFDVVAVVTFEHQESDEIRRTEMFYDGGNTWKFRFTGTQPGEWRFSSQSSSPALNGLKGTVMVTPNPGARGFVTDYGEKWGWSGTGEVFVPQLVMYKLPFYFHNQPALVDADIEEFLNRHGFNGFHVPNIGGGWFDMERIDGRINAGMADPDFRTFEALEMLIPKVHAAGGMVYIWVWGDEARRQTPIGLAGGINGPVDRRLQRYIAARLGPLPGWTMGYGFDLWEWVNGPQLTTWRDYMYSHMGWPHLLGARASKNRLDQLSEAMDYSGYEQHRPNYATYVETITQRPEKPSFSEDRFRIRNTHPYKDYDMQMTRRGLYHSAMAGGVANIWGNLDGSTHERGSAPYPNPEWIKTYATFFEDRFRQDLERCNSLTDGVCLQRSDHTAFIFYKEDTDSLLFDLTQMQGSQPAVAVDTQRPYAELDLGTFSPSQQVWAAPHASDWIIAVGSFAEERE
jgi:hypothetical protein